MLAVSQRVREASLVVAGRTIAANRHRPIVQYGVG